MFIIHSIGRDLLKISGKYRDIYDVLDHFCRDIVKENKRRKSFCLYCNEIKRNWCRSIENCNFYLIYKTNRPKKKKKSEAKAEEMESGSEEEESDD